MTVRATGSDPAGGPVLGKSRSRVLEALQAARGPLTVPEVAELVRLHPNTARFHLDGLVEHGLAERTSTGPGRPAAGVARLGILTPGHRTWSRIRSEHPFD